jgi:hypothetical protein
MPRLRCRFRLRSLIAAVAVAALGLTAWCYFAPAVSIYGDRDVPIEVRAVDAVSGRPIVGALVQVVHALYSDRFAPAVGVTGDDGRAVLSLAFPFNGRKHRFRAEGQILYGDRWLEVSAPGYRHRADPLSCSIGEQADLDAPPPGPIHMALQPGDDPAGPLAEFAGEYNRSFGMGSSTLTILADGRYAWSEFSCYSGHAEYGYARMADGALTLLPIPHERDKSDPLPRDGFYPVRWGGRLLVVPSSEMQGFCHAVNEGSEPAREQLGDFFLRSADSANDVEGLPAVPKQWAGDLLAIPITGKVVAASEGWEGKVDLGLQDGIKEGMRLKVHGGDENHSIVVRVVAVASESCDVKGEYLLEESPERFPLGARVTSRLGIHAGGIRLRGISLAD